ncbi:protein ALEX-like [Castor canadensis]|uniref:Protein ALEX-like n=1 Tax=Castor canadensis TaxID=51338 RepID=A0AC58MP09_CASCN
MSPSPSRLMARPVDPQRSPGRTSRASARPSRKPEPVEATAHLLRKPCPSRSSSPAWEVSGLPWSSLDPPLGPMQAWRPSTQCSWSPPEPSMLRDQAWEATAHHQKKLCRSSLSSLPKEAVASLSCRSQTLLQVVRGQGSLELLPRSPELSGLQTLASEEATAPLLRRLCHLSLMEKHLGMTAHPPGSPELSHKSTVAASSQQSRSRVRSASLPPQTRLPSGSPAPSAAHPERLSDLLLTSHATAPRWRSPDPGSRLAAPPLGSTTLPSTWTAPQSPMMARPSKSLEPQIRESEQRDPQLREKQRRWKEAQPPLPRKKEKSPLQGMEPLLPEPLQMPGQPLPCQPIPTFQESSPNQSIPKPRESWLPKAIPTPQEPLTLQPIPTPEQSLMIQRIVTPGEPQLIQPSLMSPGQPLSPQPFGPPGQPLAPEPILAPVEHPPLEQILQLGQPLSPGQPPLPRPPGPDATSVSSDPPARRSRLLTRLLRGLLGRPPGGASSSVAEAESGTRMRGRSVTTPPATSQTMGPSAASSGSGEIVAAESPSVTCSATSSCKLSEAASADLTVPSPKPRALPRSRRFPWRRSEDRCAKKPSRCAPRSAQTRNAASSSTSNSRTKRWTTCVRTACCF